LGLLSGIMFIGINIRGGMIVGRGGGDRDAVASFFVL